MAPRKSAAVAIPTLPLLDGADERALCPDGLVAGLDEAGRGPLAGPVVAACVVFEGEPPAGLGDSKALTAARREELFEAILACGHVAVASASPAEIDRHNIRGATLRAMARALAGLACRPRLALIDGRDVPPRLGCEGRAIVGGDGAVAAIAAASIVAKVTRDRLMTRLDAVHPGYGFRDHKGYGTAAHLAALARLGPCAAHRRSFAPVAALLPEAPEHAKEADTDAGLPIAQLL